MPAMEREWSGLLSAQERALLARLLRKMAGRGNAVDALMLQTTLAF